MKVQFAKTVPRLGMKEPHANYPVRMITDLLRRIIKKDYHYNKDLP
jgi:hypothetical protein